MDELQSMDEIKTHKDLLSQGLQASHRKVGDFLILSVEFVEFVEIILEQLRHQEQMLLMVEEVKQA
jgi:hypothetical protein